MRSAKVVHLHRWAEQFNRDLVNALREQLSFGPLQGLSHSAAQEEAEILAEKLRARGLHSWASNRNVHVSITRAQAWTLVKALNITKED